MNQAQINMAALRRNFQRRTPASWDGGHDARQSKPGCATNSFGRCRPRTRQWFISGRRHAAVAAIAIVTKPGGLRWQHEPHPADRPGRWLCWPV